MFFCNTHTYIVFILDFGRINDCKEGKLIALYAPVKKASQRTKAMENEESYDKEKTKYMGYSLLYHTTTYEIKEVVKINFEKDIVEKAYRDIKSGINLNPVRKTSN